jgi:hypothetical protein
MEGWLIHMAVGTREYQDRLGCDDNFFANDGSLQKSKRTPCRNCEGCSVGNHPHLIFLLGLR